jgi:flagellar L-ring protein precursor FlgH
MKLLPLILFVAVNAPVCLAQSSSLFQRDLPSNGHPLTLEDTSFYYQKAEPLRVLKLNDIIRVVVIESAQTNAEGNISRRKQYQLNAQLQEWIKFHNGDLVTNPAFDGDPTINGTLQGQGRAQANLQTKEGIQFKIAARVVDIRPNGHLVIEAHSIVKNNDEVWEQGLSGVVSPDKVNPKGEVISDDVAELMIDKREKGQVRDGYRRGWFYWLLDRYGMF